MIDLYTKPNCIYCDQAKDLLRSNGKPFNEIAIGDSILVEELRERYPAARTAPVVVIGGVYIGGYTELKNIFENINSAGNPELLNE